MKKLGRRARKTRQIQKAKSRALANIQRTREIVAGLLRVADWNMNESEIEHVRVHKPPLFWGSLTEVRCVNCDKVFVPMRLFGKIEEQDYLDSRVCLA